ncbi:YebC/PmpR family DNA-binding transcriptional regulator [Patescibacteria group bacterium]|nr:YebC/PmpR family DNA-binding transcriptional regulator [Patescibacteria group bacterium]MBU0922851.1 YebC/PmpR family DNA-binding transcriptional regulator [Patescibacteria group bacterium]MBU1066416.1 YebC/PmpR family DNA-binding transcriptional regulator [Patescibacteria group bacterium]MBU1844474.1 YebC/PmpR family DNA-binding transcriptional regulator [Patescibacteria group bacterium]
MSGHSHYSTIKRQKESNDAAKGQVFSKLTRAISIAVKTGGGPVPESNYKLRVAIDKARALNMPKVNIERAISKGTAGGALEEVTYEGFGPEGVAIMVEVATDNRNRSGQEIKNIFEKGGGSLAGPGAVSFNFEPRGFLIVKKDKNTEEQMLTLIDLDVEDMEESSDGIEVYVDANVLSQTREKLEGKGFNIISTELVQKPKNYQSLVDEKKASKVLSLLDNLEKHDDVQKVFANFDIPEDILEKIANE